MRYKINLVITSHAIDKYMERSNCWNRNKAITSILRVYVNGEKVILKDSYRLNKLFNNKLDANYLNVDYIKENQWVLVINNNHIITVFEASDKGFEKKI